MSQELRYGKMLNKAPILTGLVSCGDETLGGSTQITMVDPESLEQLLPGGLGAIWLSGPSPSEGYWRSGDVSDEVFRALPSGGSDTEYLRTGDIGFVHQGRLYITGRLTDLIIKYGVNYYPTNLENTVAAAVANRPARWRAAAFSYDREVETRIVIIQENPRDRRQRLDMAALVREIRQSILDYHGLALDDVVLFKPDNFRSRQAAKSSAAGAESSTC